MYRLRNVLVMIIVSFFFVFLLVLSFRVEGRVVINGRFIDLESFILGRDVGMYVLFYGWKFDMFIILEN